MAPALATQLICERDNAICSMIKKHGRHCSSLLFGTLLVGFVAQTEPLAISNVTLIDMTGKPARRAMTVVVTGDRITAITPTRQAKLSPDTHVVEGAGRFLIPGLWDMHVHRSTRPDSKWMFPLEIANGIVGVRDMFGPPDANAWRAEHGSSGQLSPAVFLASPIVDGPKLKPMRPTSIAVADAAQGRAVVAQQKDRGADFIKVYQFLSRDAFFAIADEAAQRRITFVGHVPESVRASEASDAGIKSIEHLTMVALSCSSREDEIFENLQRDSAATGAEARAYDSFDDGRAKALFARFVKNGTWQCPTLTVLETVSRLDNLSDLEKDERLKYIPKDLRQRWEPRNDFRWKDQDAAYWERRRRNFRGAMDLVGRMHRGGVAILAGTDTPNPYVYPGFSLHDELELLVQAGLSPQEALRSATLKAAEFMGQSDTRGTIETGKIADLVLLDRDPVANIRNSRSIRAVVLGGKLLDRAALDKMLADVQTDADQPIGKD
ncbi:MAG: amidohydrolase family protein [Bryobacterales bacterium]|nr:amidohydrolase family protein [Bryobacterales bacterium]